MYFLRCNENNKIILIDHELTEENLQGYTLITVEQYEKYVRIDNIKRLLSDTDYKAIKFAEGLISQEEYNEIKTQREGWREEIRQLEREIEEMNQESKQDSSEE